MIFIIWSVIALVSLVFYLQEIYSKLNRMGLKHLPVVPVFGDMTRIMLGHEHWVDHFQKYFEQFPDEKMVGRYEFLTPCVLLKDPELVKKVGVKDFENFVDRRILIDENSDPLLGRVLLFLKGKEWKGMRSALSPAFTSSKIKLMMPFIVQAGDQMISSLKSRIQQSGVDYIDLEIKEMATRYTNDVIATCAFGIHTNSHFEDNTFYNKSKDITNFTYIRILKIFLISNVPKIAKLMRVSLLTKKLQDYYCGVFLGTMKQREKNDIYRPGGLDKCPTFNVNVKRKLTHDGKTSKNVNAGFAMVEESEIGKNQSKHVWSDTDLVAQALLFLFGGFETMSITMSFLLYELAVNPEVQERLFQEIRINDKKNGGNIDYETIHQMTYLDMVVSEVLRKWPAVPLTERQCVKNYNLGKPSSKSHQDVIVRKGDTIQIPIWSFHRNARYYPNPEKFDPERFSADKKHNIDPSTYMPFGVGPRNCIGSRFALCEVKVMAYQFFKHIMVVPFEKTRIPLQLSKDGFSLNMEGGNWLRLRVRK